MSLTSWAEKEIEIAIKREMTNDPDYVPGEWHYGVACYESAHKAFKSLMEDGHSGTSISITKNILNRLIEGKPLTPIEDTDDVWNPGFEYIDDKKGYTTYQCKRMSSLFKKVFNDGTVEYNDVDRVVYVDVKEDGHEIHWSNGFITCLINEMFPITIPYIPEDKPYKVYGRDFLYDPKNGDYDTMSIDYVYTPKGERIEIDRYFKDNPEGRGMVEIDFKEFRERLEVAKGEEINSNEK